VLILMSCSSLSADQKTSHLYFFCTSYQHRPEKNPASVNRGRFRPRCKTILNYRPPGEGRMLFEKWRCDWDLHSERLPNQLGRAKGSLRASISNWHRSGSQLRAENQKIETRKVSSKTVQITRHTMPSKFRRKSHKTNDRAIH
jgi:hypothetical protein